MDNKTLADAVPAVADMERRDRWRWMWTEPDTKTEAGWLGAGLMMMIGFAAIVGNFPAWPLWQSIVVTALVLPWILVAVMLWARGPCCRGIGFLARISAIIPAVTWAVLTVVVHAIDAPVVAHRIIVPAVYAVLSAITVMWWRIWTEQTHRLREEARWSQEP